LGRLRAHILSRLFISHSSKDTVSAIAFKQWLGANGWPEEDVFLDVEDIGGGERWKDALRKAHARCEAVILLASPDALSSPECLTEVRKAEDFGKEIIVVLLRDLTIDDRRLDSFKERQIVDLSAPPQTHAEQVELRGTKQQVLFNNEALAKVRDYLVKRGITPENFPWPPEGKPEAEPFPGLSAFTEDEAAIFFGRDADILNALDEFRLLRRKGAPRLFAIQAASGAGKSSFLRAGLWPRLLRDPDFAPLAILRPARGILTGPEGLGQKLADWLSRPGAPVNPGDVYTRLMADDFATAEAEFVKLMKAAADQAHDERRIGDPGAPPPALVLAIDQAEELLAPENAAESQRLLLLVAAFMRALPLGVEPFALLTVRADSATRLYEAIAERSLEVPKPLTLLPLPRTSYRDVIVKPIDVAERHGQQIAIQSLLTEQLVAEATGADALPLLAFTLFQLYRGFGAGGILTVDHYKTLGGISGSIKKAVEEALARPRDAPTIPIAAKDQLDCLRTTFIPALARIDDATNEPVRRTARLDEFTGDARSMVDRLIEKRLLILDQQAGTEVIEVAHEALLRQWPPLAGWLHEAADDLRVVDAVDRAAGEWDRRGRADAWLDHRGDRLSAAERVLSLADFSRRFGTVSRDYLKACRARENARRRLVRSIGGAAAAALIVLAVVLFQWWQSRKETARAEQQTKVSLLIAQSQTNLSGPSGGNIPLAIMYAERAFRMMPSVQSRSTLLQAAMEISPHVATIFALGKNPLSTDPHDSTEHAVAAAWSSGDHLDVAMNWGRLRSYVLTDPTTIPAGWALPAIKRPQEGNLATVSALAPLSSDRMIAVFNEGSVGTYQRGTSVVEIDAPPQQLSVYPIAHAVAVAKTGALIAVANSDEVIILYRCDWRATRRSTPACESAPFGDAHGRAVTISPDEKRVAVGDASGAVTIYDLTGTPVGEPQKLGGPINALSWANQRNWLAAATVKGEIAVLNADALQQDPIAQATFGSSSIVALAWNPNELTLAFVCNSVSVCLWKANAGADTGQAFEPPIRLEGHSNTILRVSFAPSGNEIASAATDGTIRIWSMTQNSDTTYAFYAGASMKINKVATSPDQQHVAGADAHGAIPVWDTNTGALGRVIPPTENVEIREIAWNRSGAIASLDDNDTVRIIPSDKAQATISVPINTRAGQHISWADNGGAIAVPIGDRGVVLIKPQTHGTKTVPLGDNQQGQAWSVAALPNSSLLFVSYVGGDIRMWDISANKNVGSLQKLPEGQTDKTGVGSMSVTGDGRLLATSSGNGSVRIYDIAKQTIWQILKTETPEIATVAFSPDGFKLAALSVDNWLYIWTIGRDAAELYLAAPIITRRSLVGVSPNGYEQASWLDWIADDRVVIATSVAALRVVRIDPVKWLKRVDSLALTHGVPID
jgi:WD40 repeat protein